MKFEARETDLPIGQVLPQIAAALSGAGGAAPRAVLTAEPGAGKSTIAPLFLLEQAWAKRKRIILLEPRRLAARAVARRMAQLLGEEAGQTVGYAMRMERKYTAETRIVVMTEGSFTRLILDNPELEGIAAVLFDEFHERSLDADFGLALALDVADSLRPDLRLLMMSATLDTARAAALLDSPERPAPVIKAAGRSFPVEIIYRPRGADIRGGSARSERLEDAMAKAIGKALSGSDGGILAFLPGQAEIKRTQTLLEDMLAREIAEGKLFIAPLYGALSAAEQEKAINPALKGMRKIVLATSIAESALTIEDIRIAVDSGLARLPVYEPASGVTRLQTVRASRASAEQRAGRAGRMAAGLAVRLWREEQNSALPAYQPPEILSADMSGLLLDCADFGITNPASLRFLDAPPAAAINQARQGLQALGALNAAGQITPVGRALRQLNLPASLSFMLLNAARRWGRAGAKRAADIAMLLTEAGLGGASEDLDIRLENFSRDKSPRAAKARNLSISLAEKAASLADALPGAERRDLPQGAGAILASARRDRVAHLRETAGAAAGRRDDKSSYILANGRGAFLDKSSSLIGKPWLVCAELTGSGADSRIRAAAEIDETWLKQHLADEIASREIVFFDEASGSLRAAREVRLGAIMLGSSPLPPPKGEAVNQGWIAALRERGLDILPWDGAANALRARLAFLRKVIGAPWPDVSDAALSARLEDWLPPFLPGLPDFAGNGGFLAEALRALPDYSIQRDLDHLAPSHWTAPTGSSLPLRYENGAAILAVRAQELFGLKVQPAVAGGAVPVTFELLSPARRVLQITRDIAGFWQGSWADVAAEMRGRYPKHFWPQDPGNADPACRAKPRKPA